MSKQFDDYIDGTFEIYGETYKLVEPHDLDSLSKAIEIKEIINTYISGLTKDEPLGNYAELLAEQESYIKSFLESLGEFDNSLLSKNITYLAKKNNLKIGDIERMIKISVGYISRTTREGTTKKLSIDVVWKLAKFFNIGINALINTDLRIPNTNTELLIDFLGKMLKDTHSGILNWKFDGGLDFEVEPRYIDLGLVDGLEEGEESKTYTYRYYPKDHLNPNFKWYIGDSIICCEKFVGNKDIVMIPVGSERFDGIQSIDCYFVWAEDNVWKWQKVFYSTETPLSELDEYARTFYYEIKKLEFDDKVLPEVKNLIKDYLKGV